MIATFPSYDVMGFAVHKSTGILSMAQIAKEKFPLRLSTHGASAESILSSPTMFTVTAVMKAAGFTLSDLTDGAAASSPCRAQAILTGATRFNAAASMRCSMKVSRVGARPP